MRTLRIILVAMLTFCGGTCLSQLNNRVFEDRMRLEEADSGKLFGGLNAMAFLKNNEYFNTIIDGYTLFGFQFQPYLSYHINKQVRIDAGAYFQKDFGNEKISTIAPIFSIKWRKKDYSIVFGNLESSLNHRLIEPLYDFERVLNHRLETGIQFQLNREDFFIDTWLDWQYMEYLKDSAQEQFQVGVSIQKKIASIGTGTLSLPAQLTSRHQGGQLNSTGLPNQTLVNTAIGLNWTQPVNGWVRQVTVNGYYVFDKDITKSRQAYLDGDGVYFNAMLSTKFGLDMMASYWHANEFIAFQGGKIYQSVSSTDPGRVQPTPHLAILRFLYNYKIGENLFLTLRYEPFYDLSYKSFQYSYGFYVNYRDRYFLIKRKR